LTLIIKFVIFFSDEIRRRGKAKEAGAQNIRNSTKSIRPGFELSNTSRAGFAL
jgi:hypothetical protein